MPKEPDTAADGESTTSGDRLNNGDMIAAFVTLGNAVASDACTATDGVEVVLGAASLVAPTAAILYALVM